MTGDPISLDGHRTVTGQHAARMRRRPVNGPPGIAPQPPTGALDAEMQADPARTWPEVMAKWQFLLDRYAATPDAADARIQKLIRRALGDMERLTKREARE